MGNLSNKLNDATFYAMLDTGYVLRENILEKCNMLLNAGVKIVQLRAKKESRLERKNIALEILPLFEKSDAEFVINDDVELAGELHTGVHVGQDDMSPIEARRIIGNDRVLGLSTHSIEQARKAMELGDILDYFAVGPVYATRTKPGRAAVGLELVSEVSKANPTLPWFAIGGVNMKTAHDVRMAGAKRIVAVSDVLMPKDTTGAIEVLVKVFIG